MSDTKIERRREAAKRGMERLRRGRGVRPRPEPSEPWVAEGVSRRTWFYRRAKAKAAAAVPGAAEVSIAAAVPGPAEISAPARIFAAPKARPRALDLFCGAGGASVGYHRAGYDVVGVDLFPQPRYPFPFIQGDALDLPIDFLRSFDTIHASPPCQAHSALKTMHNAHRHADLIPATRAMLRASGVPYVIENVPGAPLINPIRLCGTMFGLGVDDAELRRHRLFETSFPVLPLKCRHCGAADVLGVYGGHVRNRRRRTIGVYGEGCRDSRRKGDKGVPDFSIEQGREAMEINHMTTAELSQAIPPAYAEYIGIFALAAAGYVRVRGDTRRVEVG
jgi:DNA (cytosine-5)-methyltransferase 1